MEFGAADTLENILEERGVLSPDERFEERIGETGKNCSGCYLRPEFCPFGNSAGDYCRYAGGKAEQKEVVDKIISLAFGESWSAGFRNDMP